MTRKAGSKMLIDCPSDMMNATPRNAAIVPSVAITALTPPIVMIRPLARPATAPTAMPNRIARVAEPVQPTASAMQTVESPTMAPTEMSSPPEMMTIVCAVASTPRMAMPWPIFSMLRARKKTSGRRLPKIATRIASAISRLKLCVPTNPIARRSGARPRGRPGRRPRRRSRPVPPRCRRRSRSWDGPRFGAARQIVGHRQIEDARLGRLGARKVAHDPPPRPSPAHGRRGPAVPASPRRSPGAPCLRPQTGRSGGRSRPSRPRRCRGWARRGSAASAGGRASGPAPPSAGCRPRAWPPAGRGSAP